VFVAKTQFLYEESELRVSSKGMRIWGKGRK